MLDRAAGAASGPSRRPTALKFTADAKWGSLAARRPADHPGRRDRRPRRPRRAQDRHDAGHRRQGRQGAEDAARPANSIQIGRAWKLVDGPDNGGHDSAAVPVIPENLRDLVGPAQRHRSEGDAEPADARSPRGLQRQAREWCWRRSSPKFPPRSKKSGSSNWPIASPARRMSRSRAIGTSAG